MEVVKIILHARIQNVFPRGPTLTTFFIQLTRGERIQIPLKAGHHRSADDGSTLNAGLVAL